MKIDAIFSDLDDTLLDSEGKFTDYTLSVLHECTKRGIQVIPCSGRTRCSLLPFVKILNTGSPYIGGNGSEIIAANGEYIDHQVLDVDTLREICRLLEEYHLYGHFYDEDRFYYNFDGDAAEDYRHSSRLTGIHVEKLSEFVHFPTSKVLVVNAEEVNRAFYPIIKEHFGDRIDITFSKSIFMELIPPGVSKGNAVKKLITMEGINPDRVLAFGDGLNDVSMLSAIPHGVAVQNAREEVRKVAWRICGSNVRDGVAHFIEETVLNDREEIKC